MQYIIIDMEFNTFKNEYSTNHNEEKATSINQEHCPNEIMQIGVVKLYKQMKNNRNLKNIYQTNYVFFGKSYDKRTSRNY